MWTYHGAGEHPTKSHEGAIADDFRLFWIPTNGAEKRVASHC